MGTRYQQLKCTDCTHRWWVSFDHKSREQLRELTVFTECPECESDDWKLTDATEFAGGPVHTTDETCPECDYDASLTVVLRCGSLHEFILHDDVEATDVSEVVDDADLGAETTTCPECGTVEVERFDNYCTRCGALLWDTDDEVPGGGG